jgi:phosphoribosyl 1,2-cyclic phosphodiesterase
VKVRFWGTRGSFAMSGPEFLRYGGNTTAVEVQNRAGRRVLIDLGTGCTELGKELMAGEFGQGKGELPVLLSHTHLDHIQGLPFFTPFFIKGNQINILGHQPGITQLNSVFQTQLNPHYSPLYGLENLAAGVTIRDLEPGSSLPVEGFEVSAILVPHGTMQTMAFRIQADGAVVVFLSDVEYTTDDPPKEVLELARCADLLIHDSMFSDEEYEARKGWGHSSVSVAVKVAERAGVASLALFHHNTDASDDVIDRMVMAAQEKTSLAVFGAAEGRAIPVTAGALETTVPPV